MRNNRKEKEREREKKKRCFDILGIGVGIIWDRSSLTSEESVQVWSYKKKERKRK